MRPSQDLIEAICKRSIRELERDVVERATHAHASQSSLSGAPKDPESKRTQYRGRASGTANHQASASPQGAYSTKNLLNPDEQRMLERIARFPYETIDERCRSERIDRMVEWHHRKTLTQLGYVQLCGKIGRVEYFSATEKAFSLLTSRGISQESHKGGVFHAVVIKRIADDLAQRMPEALVKHDGQFSGVQPDMTITSLDGTCSAIQVSITNSPEYEADCAVRLAALDAFQRVLVVCTSEKKVLAVKKAVAQRAGGLFPGDEHGEKVEVVHARVIVDQQMDWQALLTTSRTVQSEEQVSAQDKPVTTTAHEGSGIGSKQAREAGEAGPGSSRSVAAAGSAGATAASLSNAPAVEQAELRRSEAGMDCLDSRGSAGEEPGRSRADGSTTPGTGQAKGTITNVTGARPAVDEQDAGRKAQAGPQEPDRGGRASDDGQAAEAAVERLEWAVKAEGPEAWMTTVAEPEGTEETKESIRGWDTDGGEEAKDTGESAITLRGTSGCGVGRVPHAVPDMATPKELEVKVGSNAAGEPRPGQTSEGGLAEGQGAKDPDRETEPGLEGQARKGTDPEATQEDQQDKGSRGASESEPEKAGTADAEGRRAARDLPAAPRAGSGTGRPEGGLGEDNLKQGAANQSSDRGRGPGPEPGEGADQTDRPRKPDDREGGRRKGSETRTAGTTRTARTDKPGVRKVSSVKGTTTKAGAYQGGTVLPPEAGIISRQGRVRRNPRAARDDDDDDGTGRTEVVEEYLEGGVSVDEAERVRPIGCTNKNDFEAKAVKEGKKESRRLNLKGERLAVEEHEQKGIDLACEDVISLREAVERLPRRGGKKLHISTLYRWIQSGVRGHRLETIRIGGMQCTSVEALQRFCSNLSDRQPERAPLRVRHGLRKRRTDDILTRAGLLDEPSKGRATRSVKHQTKALEQAKSEADGSA